MKRSVILLVALLTVVSGAYAQRDDMYYRPSKKIRSTRLPILPKRLPIRIASIIVRHMMIMTDIPMMR